MDDLNKASSALAQKIKHLIITNSGSTADAATTEEFYQAFCATLREEMMINWTASLETIEQKKVRMAYFLCMEYLPGRLLGNNIANLGAADLVKAILAKLNRNFSDLSACETDPGLGHGGLGRLSSCFLDSIATLHYPVRAYGLRYQYGIFEQEIWDGLQVEKPDRWLLNENPWERRRDSHAVSIRFKGQSTPSQNTHGEPIELLENFEEVRAVPYDTPVIGYSASDYSVLMLRLWSTKESPRNFQLQRYNAGFFEQAAENTSLTDLLYPNDNTELGKQIRLKQEFLLVSASLQDIIRHVLKVHGDMFAFADKVRIQINDTHPALVIAELVRILTKDFDFSWRQAWEICQTVCSYTSHSILPEALEEWNEKRMRELLPRQYRIIQRLNQELCDSTRSRFPEDEARIRRLSMIQDTQVRMAHLAIIGSHKVNGVAKLHTELLKTKVFPDFFELFPDRFLNITNGVTQRRWLLHANPLLASFITERIGSGWITDFMQIGKLAKFASDPQSQNAFLAIKKKNKEALETFLARENCIRDRSGKIIAHSASIGSSALFDVHTKRFHEYKRQLMNVLHLIMLYWELKENPEARKVRRFAIFSGKAAPNYVRAKQILDLTYAVCRTLCSDTAVSSRLSAVFIENYNVSKAERIIPAADLSEQISAAGWEASGTGNMKLAMNGALTIGTEDGANIEMREAVGEKWWPFAFGSTAKENQLPYHPQEIYAKNRAIRRAVDSLKEGPFSDTAAESAAFAKIHKYLIKSDPYRVLKDLPAYYEAQQKAEALFLQPHAWAETAIHNIAAMGSFSTDRSIRDYAEKVWELTPCLPNPAILKKVRQEYSEHDQCRLG